MAADHWPQLDPRINIIQDTDIAGEWERFEIFEALHHSIDICNPMTSAHLDEIIETMDLGRDSVVLDVACGFGELLLRAGAHEADGIGVDLSPWMLHGLLRRASERSVVAPEVWLGDAKRFTPPRPVNRVVCIGAEWVWHDAKGTARALRKLCADDGLVVVGAARLHHDANQIDVGSSHGVVPSVDDIEQAFRGVGIEPVHRVDPSDDDWDNYLAETAQAVAAWQAMHPGPRAERWRDEQQEWLAARERDRGIMGWSTWVARCAPPSA